MKTNEYDKIIIGAGFYGLYAALYCARKSQKILVIELENLPFSRATFVNQARVHQGYHYPRSISTALKSAKYFERFNKDYECCINKEFEQIYATSSRYSWSNGQQFKGFCKAAGIPCEELHPGKFFRDGMCDGAFLTREFTYDAVILRDYMLGNLEKYSSRVDIQFGAKIIAIEKQDDVYDITLEDGRQYASGFILNATYAGVNQILRMTGLEEFQIKYELCEIILCDVNEKLSDIGITVMDGPFFSIMPFGKSGYHSLTAVTFTPHATSYNEVPVFKCQENSNGYCKPMILGNCNACNVRPSTSFPYMERLAKKYMLDSYEFKYKSSLFSMKPILMNSEIDDSRPTVIRTCSKNPTFVAVLSGKINTVYDLDEVLNDDF